ncbi:NAD kinase [Tomitella gaofuii]|uniref:NAD kinase n=1 Tax=Tomitella gaofuii TaxID=2760083 RepID=UPI0015F7B57B|nr:NAD kinase [Tomitella gaofuii]
MIGRSGPAAGPAPARRAPGEPTAEREILLVAHTGRASIADTARRVSRILADGGIGLRVLDDEADRTGLRGAGSNRDAHGAPARVVPHDHRAAAGCEMVIVLGGDGTFLRAAELAWYAGAPVLGINLGRIGFLAEAEADHLDEALGSVIRGHYRIEHRMTLDVRLCSGETTESAGWALNEVSIERGRHVGVLELLLEIDGRPVSSFGCDGLLVSTPTGSTAYAFSAGGPVVWPELEAILVVPNNAHALFSRPMVTSPSSVIAVEVEPSGSGAVMYCDGRRAVHVPAGARLEVVRGRHPVRWVRLDSVPFADRMVHKFALPVRGWRGRGA